MLSRITRLFAATPAARKATPRPHLSVEALEDRAVPAFLTPVTSPGEGVPIVADFNHDGRSDVAVLHAVTGSVTFGVDGTSFDLNVTNKSTITVGLSNGDGTFRQTATLGGIPGYYVGAMRALDVNGDGHVDIDIYTSPRNSKQTTTTSTTTMYENVWLGHGDGTFGAITTTTTTQWLLFGLPTTQHTYSFPHADFDHDGHIDGTQLSADYGAFVRVRLGTGTANQVVLYAAGPSPDLLAVGDFNGDGWADLLVVNSLDGTGSNAPTLSVLLNDGTW